eukprot:Gb_38538 [translate_table: standard]
MFDVKNCSQIEQVLDLLNAFNVYPVMLLCKFNMVSEPMALGLGMQEICYGEQALMGAVEDPYAENMPLKTAVEQNKPHGLCIHKIEGGRVNHEVQNHLAAAAMPNEKVAERRRNSQNCSRIEQVLGTSLHMQTSTSTD